MPGSIYKLDCDATIDDYADESTDYIYDLKKCLSVPERNFVARFHERYTWSSTYRLISKHTSKRGMPVGVRLNGTGPWVIAVSLLSATHRNRNGPRNGSVTRYVNLGRMVFTMFVGPIPPNCFIRPRNGDSSDHHLDNLLLIRKCDLQEVKPGDYRGEPVRPSHVILEPLQLLPKPAWSE